MVLATHSFHGEDLLRTPVSYQYHLRARVSPSAAGFGMMLANIRRRSPRVRRISMIDRIHIKNYRIFEDFWLDCNDDLNILVGDNDSGKSTVLEAINLALTRRLNGRGIELELSPQLFNQKCAREYIEGLKSKELPEPPRILIELFLKEDPAVASLRGDNNSKDEDCCGVRLEIEFNEEFADEYQQLIATPGEIRAVPTEYYKVSWMSFGNNAITSRSMQLGASFIDATTIRLHSGTDYYLHNIIKSGLPVKERAGLAMAFRGMKEKFGDHDAIKEINKNLGDNRGAITDRELSVGIDISQKATWETSLTPHLDEVPFQLIGKGEQNALKIMLALDRRGEDAHIILMEEPENHLSFSSMNILIDKILGRCDGKQIFITTHSAYVLNRLGIDKVILIHGDRTLLLKSLSATTYNYFKKLSGYDTLRLILARRAILVEGPSDELIVQKAYLTKHKKLPLADGCDVINVRGLSFKRFLEIAQQLGKPVAVVTDNDGDYAKKVIQKYKAFEGDKNIRICADSNDKLKTLEPQVVDCNDLATLNGILGQSHANEESLVEYMTENKTEWALKLFETATPFNMPKYVEAAIEK